MKKTIGYLFLILLLANTCSRTKVNGEHDPDQSILGNYTFSSITVESNNIDLNKYKNLSKNKTYINDYQSYATNLDEQKKYDELVYDEISKIINVNKDLDENLYINIEKNNHEGKDYIMYSNFWLLPYLLQGKNGYLEYSFDDYSKHNENNYFLQTNVEEFVSPAFRKVFDLNFTYI